VALRENLGSGTVLVGKCPVGRLRRKTAFVVHGFEVRNVERGPVSLFLQVVGHVARYDFTWNLFKNQKCACVQTLLIASAGLHNEPRIDD